MTCSSINGCRAWIYHWVWTHTPRYHPRAEIGLPADMCPASPTIAVDTITSAPTDPYRHQPLSPVPLPRAPQTSSTPPDRLCDGRFRLRQRDTVQIHGNQVWLLPRGAAAAGGPMGHQWGRKIHDLMLQGDPGAPAGDPGAPVRAPGHGSRGMREPIGRSFPGGPCRN